MLHCVNITLYLFIFNHEFVFHYITIYAQFLLLSRCFTSFFCWLSVPVDNDLLRARHCYFNNLFTNDIINFADVDTFIIVLFLMFYFLSLVSFTEKVNTSEVFVMLFPEIYHLYANDLMHLIAFSNIKFFIFLIINLNVILLLHSGDIESNSGPKTSLSLTFSHGNLNDIVTRICQADLYNRMQL